METNGCNRFTGFPFSQVSSSGSVKADWLHTHAHAHAHTPTLCDVFFFCLSSKFEVSVSCALSPFVSLSLSLSLCVGVGGLCHSLQETLGILRQSPFGVFRCSLTASFPFALFGDRLCTDGDQGKISGQVFDGLLITKIDV